MKNRTCDICQCVVEFGFHDCLSFIAENASPRVREQIRSWQRKHWYPTMSHYNDLKQSVEKLRAFRDALNQLEDWRDF